MKVVLVIASLGAGGAERVMSILANHWAGQGWDIALLTLDDGAEPPFYPLHPAVRHRSLSLTGESASTRAALVNNLRRLRVLRRTIRQEQPTVVLSFIDTTNVLVLLALVGSGIPVVVSEHIEPSQYVLKPVWNTLRRWLYPSARRIVVLTDRARAFFPGALRSRIDVIPNPVTRPALASGGPVRAPGRRLIAMGRLCRQKGFDLLLEAFARLAPRHPDWTLTILGEGPLRAELEALRDDHGLTGRVEFPGRLRNPESILATADLFVLPSRFEGFPMALCEAMAAGLPVVAADCPTGPREIVRPGIDGILVPPEDPAALAAALADLMDDAAARARLAARAGEITERFSLNRVAAHWEQCLAGAVGQELAGP